MQKYPFKVLPCAHRYDFFLKFRERGAWPFKAQTAITDYRIMKRPN